MTELVKQPLNYSNLYILLTRFWCISFFPAEFNFPSFIILELISKINENDTIVCLLSPENNFHVYF